MKPILFAIFMFCIIALNAQTKITSQFNKAGTYVVRKLHRNDSILILCDTVYLVNKPLYEIYSGLYLKQKNIQSLVNESNGIFQSHINEMEKQYGKLNDEYNLNIAEFRKYRDNTRMNMDSLQLNLKNAELSVSKARSENEKLKEQLNKSIGQDRSTKYYFGLAGISIGLIIALLIK